MPLASHNGHLTVHMVDWRPPERRSGAITPNVLQLGPPMPRPKLGESLDRAVALCRASKELRERSSRVRLEAAERLRQLSLARPTVLRGGSDGAPHLVLVVDDFVDSRAMYAKFFRFNGLRTIEAGDGEAALALAADASPDVVLMDLGLPMIDGWEVIRRLKSDLRTERIPVVVITGHVFADSRERAMRAGCDVYLVKPCLPDDVLGTIRRLLPRGR